MRSFWIIWVGPKLNDKCPYKRHREERHRGKRDSQVKMAEIGVMLPQAINQATLGATRG